MKFLQSKKGEGYIEFCVHILIFVAMIIISINVFSFVNLYVEMGRVSDELIQAATYNGGFTEDFWEAETKIREQSFDYTVTTDAEKYFNETYQRVQLGDIITVTITKESYLEGIGFKVPVTVTTSRSGISEKYWK